MDYSSAHDGSIHASRQEQLGRPGEGIVRQNNQVRQLSLLQRTLELLLAGGEGGAELEFFINAKAYNALSSEFRAIVDAATDVAARDMTAKYDAMNPVALKRLVAAKTQLKSFSKDIMDAGFKAAMQVFAEHEAKSPEFKKIHQDMRAFQRDQILWGRFSEYRYDDYILSVKL